MVECFDGVLYQVFQAPAVAPRGDPRGDLHLDGRALCHQRLQFLHREAQTLGFKKLIIPASNKTGLEKLLGIRVVGVKNLEEALEELF